MSEKKKAGAAVKGKSGVPYPELFKPIKIGSVEIKNRVVMAPMNTVMS